MRHATAGDSLARSAREPPENEDRAHLGHVEDAPDDRHVYRRRSRRDTGRRRQAL